MNFVICIIHHFHRKNGSSWPSRFVPCCEFLRRIRSEIMKCSYIWYNCLVVVPFLRIPVCKWRHFHGYRYVRCSVGARPRTLRLLQITRRLRPARKISGWIRIIIWGVNNRGLDCLVFPSWYTIICLTYYAFEIYFPTDPCTRRFVATSYWRILPPKDEECFLMKVTSLISHCTGT